MLQVVTAPIAEPVALIDAKGWMGVDFTRDDSIIKALLASAWQRAEHETGRCLLSSTWELNLDEWPGDDEIRLPKPPLTSVTSVKYYDTAGVLQTLSSAAYHVDSVSAPGRICLASGYSWPALQCERPNAVVIRFIAGYADAAAVPEAIKQWIMVSVGTEYREAQGLLPATALQTLPFVNALLDPYRIYTL